MNIKMNLISLFVLVLTFIMFVGCSSVDDCIISNVSTGKVVASFSTKKHEDETIMLVDAENNVSEKAVKVKSKPKYMVHFVDPKSSLHDVYYYLYIEKENMYIQYNMDKMNKLEERFHVGLDDSIKKTNGITVDEFNSILTKFKVD